MIRYLPFLDKVTEFIPLVPSEPITTKYVRTSRIIKYLTCQEVLTLGFRLEDAHVVSCRVDQSIVFDLDGVRYGRSAPEKVSNMLVSRCYGLTWG